MPPLKDYQSTILKRFGEGRSFGGAKILEVGGERQTAEWFLERGAEEVWVCDPSLKLPSSVTHEGPITLTNNFAQDIWQITDQKFDFVFGIAVLEHFCSLASHLSELRRIMKRHATLYLHGGPIWTFSKGHHVWVRGTRQYHFNNFDPILPWEHLYACPDMMADRLVREGFPDTDVRAIIDFIYLSSNLSRLSYSDLRSIFLDDTHFYQRQWIEVHNGTPPDGSLRPGLEARFGKQPFTVRAVMMDMIAK